jgi:hypothetical protein
LGVALVWVIHALKARFRSADEEDEIERILETMIAQQQALSSAYLEHLRREEGVD